MDKRIYKYDLEITEEQSIEIQKNYRILSIQSQKDSLRLWALIDKDETIFEKIDIRIYGTGKTLPENISAFQHYTTIELCDGNLVWHIFLKTSSL